MTDADVERLADEAERGFDLSTWSTTRPDDRPNFRAVAQGNHVVGYRGIIVEDWDGPTERVVARCRHRHATTTEARSCVGAFWFHGSWADVRLTGR